ncbi:MAG: hypothetical protein ACREA0_01610 [bacterium]
MTDTRAGPRTEDVIFNHLIHTASAIAGRHAQRVRASGGAYMPAYHRGFERVLKRFMEGHKP